MAFSHIVADPAKSGNPVNLTFSLSAENNSFIIEVLGDGAPDKEVVGILFNLIPNASTASVSLTAGTTVFSVAPEYDNTEAALYYSDGTCSVFTILTGASDDLPLDPVSRERGPEQRRKFLLGFK